jgi:hypothetical protein
MYLFHHLLLLAQQEHVQDLLQEAAQMRLAKKAKPKRHHDAPLHKLLSWLDALSLRMKGGHASRNLPANPSNPREE